MENFMNTTVTSKADKIVERLAEHRLDWDRIREGIEAAADHDHLDNPPDHHFGPYVALTRQSGTDAGLLADRIGEALGWSVLDGEIVDIVADAFHLDGIMLHMLDEARANWVRDVLGELMPEAVVNRDTYVHHLGRVLRMVALHGRVVLVGRAAQLFLPRERGIAVRVVAPVEDRVSRMSARSTDDPATARRRVEDTDRRRSGFVKHYFGRDADDPLLYDLVLNAATLSTDDMVRVVVAACRRHDLDSDPKP
jgi:cytidylate kinase